MSCFTVSDLFLLVIGFNASEGTEDMKLALKSDDDSKHCLFAALPTDLTGGLLDGQVYSRGGLSR